MTETDLQAVVSVVQDYFQMRFEPDDLKEFKQKLSQAVQEANSDDS